MQIQDIGEHVPLLSIIPKTKENQYYYKNGLSKVIPRLTLKVHSEIEECHDLWQQFTPARSLFDSWDFRYSWHSSYGLKPFFYTLYEGKTPLAMLPLSFDSSDKKRYEWFGTNWMEDNKFFVKDEHFIDLLYAIFPTPIHLNAIEKTSDWSKMKIDSELKIDDSKNIKDISIFKTVDDLVGSFQKKHRYNLKVDYHDVMSLNPRIVETEEKSLELIEEMMRMNVEQFKDTPNDESDLTIPKRAETYRNLVRNSNSYKVKFIQIFIQNRLAAIDFIIKYKDVYYTIKGGIDVNRFKGLSNFMVYYEFEDAIKNNFSKIDCLQIDYGWKHRFFDQTPTFLFEK